MTQGEWMYYGGMAGAVCSFLLVIIWKIILRIKRRKLRKILGDEYFHM